MSHLVRHRRPNGQRAQRPTPDAVGADAASGLEPAAPNARRTRRLVGARRIRSALGRSGLAVVMSALLLSLPNVALGAHSPSPQQSRPLPFTLHAIENVTYPDVRDIVQDGQGFIWVGANHQTAGGLLRYDGYETKRYANDIDDPTSLSHNQVSATFVDRNGVLWVGTIRGGLNRYNAAADSFTRFLHNPDDANSLPNDDIETIAQSGDGMLWVGTETGLARLDPATGAVTSFRYRPDVDNGLAHHRVQSIAEDPTTGTLWLGTSGGVSLFDPRVATFRNYRASDDPYSLNSDEVYAVVVDDAGVLWAGTSEGLNRYDRENDRFVPLSTKAAGSDRSMQVRTLLADSQGRLWVGYDGGVGVFDRDGATLREVGDEAARRDVLGGALVQALYEDRDGAIWIGTRSAGAARVSPVPPGVKYHRHDAQRPDTVNSDFVARIDVTANGAWVVTDKGVEFFDGTRFVDYTERFGLEGGWPSVHALLAAGPDHLWLGFNDGHLARVEVETGEMQRFAVPAPANGSAVWPVAETSNGDVWYRVPWGYGVGVLRSDGTSELLIGDSVDVEGPEQVYAYNTSHYFDEAQQVLWVSGLGLARIELATSSVEVYSFDRTNPESVANQLWSVDEGPLGRLWLASSHGVHKFDPATGEFVELITEGVPAGGVTDARFGPDGRLWLVAGATLTGLDLETGDTVSYSAADDVPGSNRMPMAGWVASKFEVGLNNKMYAPTLDQGVVEFAPNRLATNQSPPPVALTGFELSGREVRVGDTDSVLPTAINRLETLRLGPNQNSFTFEFSALGYEHPERNSFRYRLEGFDNEWVSASADRRFATYTNVPPGNYVFRVTASNNSGVWNAEGVALTVTVLTPWYSTWWARVCGFALAAVALVAVFRWRTRRQRERNRELRDRLEERMLHQEERELLLAQVQQQSERLAGILAAAPIGVVLLGPDQEVLLENRVAIEELRSMARFDGDGNLDKFAGLSIHDLIGGEREGAWATTTVDDGGSVRFLSVTIRPIQPWAGHRGADQKGWVLLWDDITELEELQQRRAREERLAAVGRFAAGIAHDVNNVLTVIGLSVEHLTTDAELEPAARTHVDRIEHETNNASRFITQILDFSRQSVSQPEQVDAAALVADQVHALARLRGPDVNIEFHGAGPSTILADPSQLERVVLNLVTNAHDAVGDAGTIFVVVGHVSSESTPEAATVKHRDGIPKVWVRLAVTDDGDGIPEEVLPTIFEPFVTTKPVGKGTGLGLAQVAGICAEHGGRVMVATKEGVGTTVSVLFPAVNPAEFDAEFSDSAAHLIVGGDGNVPILLGEDVLPNLVPARSQ